MLGERGVRGIHIARGEVGDRTMGVGRGVGVEGGEDGWVGGGSGIEVLRAVFL